MEAVKASISALTSAIEGDRAESARQREMQADRLSNLESVVASIRADMDEVKPLAMRWKSWQNIGIGVLMAVGAIGAVGQYVFDYFHDAITSLLGLGK